MSGRTRMVVTGKAAAGGKRPARRAPESPAVSASERRHLIEDIAYFHAERYRAVEAGGCREEDRREAEAEIEAVLHRRRKR